MTRRRCLRDGHYPFGRNWGCPRRILPPPTGRSLAAQLLHRKVLQDAIFGFVQIVVVRIEDVARAVDVNLTTP